jgi:hypothetical protein
MGGIADNLSNSMPMTDCVDKVLDRLSFIEDSKDPPLRKVGPDLRAGRSLRGEPISREKKAA